MENALCIFSGEVVLQGDRIGIAPQYLPARTHPDSLHPVYGLITKSIQILPSPLPLCLFIVLPPDAFVFSRKRTQIFANNFGLFCLFNHSAGMTSYS